MRAPPLRCASCRDRYRAPCAAGDTGSHHPRRLRCAGAAPCSTARAAYACACATAAGAANGAGRAAGARQRSARIATATPTRRRGHWLANSASHPPRRCTTRTSTCGWPARRRRLGAAGGASRCKRALRRVPGPTTTSTLARRRARRPQGARGGAPRRSAPKTTQNSSPRAATRLRLSDSVASAVCALRLRAYYI